MREGRHKLTLGQIHPPAQGGPPVLPVIEHMAEASFEMLAAFAQQRLDHPLWQDLANRCFGLPVVNGLIKCLPQVLEPVIADVIDPVPHRFFFHVVEGRPD
ncbi:hypothetical protein Hsar01_03965 [Haloferula sargassicola]|uniref:Uncharacterized protein n=1 Tax=Haloferula sargassicola TaxID=490096 RepID=A0ABP9UTM8_9BACT